MSVQLAMTMQEDDRTDRVVIDLPFLPPSKNRYDGWQPAWKSSARKRWQRELKKRLLELDVPKGKAVDLAVTLVFASKRRRDWQNYVHPLMYWVADALVQHGVIPDDTPNMFRVGPNGGIVFAVDRRMHMPVEKRQRTILELTVHGGADPGNSDSAEG